MGLFPVVDDAVKRAVREAFGDHKGKVHTVFVDVWWHMEKWILDSEATLVDFPVFAGVDSVSSWTGNCWDFVKRSWRPLGRDSLVDVRCHLRICIEDDLEDGGQPKRLGTGLLLLKKMKTTNLPGSPIAVHDGNDNATTASMLVDVSIFHHEVRTAVRFQVNHFCRAFLYSDALFEIRQETAWPKQPFSTFD
ncbi:hypothetical protein S7711_11158 [Stachybotrys chartarum IBT 7711]|uniref:Uncharacterized protein n=1 Tax=Stachybotrys chartarum (strain CBS 109288 / IBT 7711) TaxID=1280523 RepID=A0A084B7F6_STACB|nr:hypothetical protein S7711_11158 [Stachybotrys chartarum IBT 7711]